MMLMTNKMVRRAFAALMYLLMSSLAKVEAMMRRRRQRQSDNDNNDSYCLSWRLGVEANNVRSWRTVPLECYNHVQQYMTGGQYLQDMNLIVNQIVAYAFQITLSPDSMDAWILDVDDTCISNLSYYQGHRFGCDPFDSAKFKAWIMKERCPANPAVLQLFKTLKERGFKVFLLTGRDQATLGKITIDNLHNQGFIGYERLILRTAEYKGQSAVRYKSAIRKEIEGQGYRIWGNVGDQWSDLQGDCLGTRTFKLPNPMYFIS
ncbi:acid phosphatase 1 [Arachis hypogaea]|uniref:acid phosphatase 1 n=1 Tax=Arachis hypogaea TaxID=3818 RepID=UPI000DECF70A|nr:acid phosphatase 1 [Arachis hypogaea]